jgi:hypothetical protein
VAVAECLLLLERVLAVVVVVDSILPNVVDNVLLDDSDNREKIPDNILPYW